MTAANNINDAQLKIERELVEAFYRAFTEKDYAALEKVLTPDWDDIPLAPGQGPGPEGLKPIMEMVLVALPDVNVAIHDVIQVPGRMAVRAEFSGTHKGPLFGIEPTGKRVSFRIHEFHTFVDGRIKTTWHLEDWFGLFNQLGRFPSF